jgi:MFS family permease
MSIMQSIPSSRPAPASPSVLAALMPIVAAMFVAWLVIGVALPVLPLHVHTGLGLGAFMVGLVTGAQFTASLLSRIWSGNLADRHGGQRNVVIGLVIAAASGLVYLLSVHFLAAPMLSFGILLCGRAVLGIAESFIVTGALTWGFTSVGAANAGKVMSWTGTAMYIAFAVGAPLGSALYGAFGFVAIAVTTTLVPLAALLIVVPRPSGASIAVRPRASFRTVARSVWLPGLGLAFSAVGFGSITTFIVLLFAQHGWGQAWLAFTVLSIAFAGARVIFGHLPDRIGGAKVALIFVVIEAAGQALIWLAPWSALALVGAALTGLGYSLVYPGFGVEAVRRSPPENRGLATGTYTAFLDLALGIAGPALGLVASGFGLDAVFLVSTVVVLGAVAVATSLVRAAH